MRVYVTARFKGIENKADIEALCAAVHQAGLEDVCFIRDVEHWQKAFPDPRELWSRSLLEVKQCDALLIDVSDNPGGGRVLEAGIAYALGMPIFVLVKEGIPYKEIFTGIATEVITYAAYDDIIPALSTYAS